MSECTSNTFKILNNILHGIIVTNKRGHITYWNDASENILGYKSDEISGKPVRLLYGDDHLTPFKKILRECTDGNDMVGRWHAVHKNGSRVWLDIKAKMLSNKADEGDSFLISICDLRKLIFAEKKLKKNMAISQAIFDTSLDSMITINDKNRIETINRAAEVMFGYLKEELVGKNVDILMPASHSIHHDKYLRKYLDTGERSILNSRRETQGLKKDGTVFPIDLGVTEVVVEEKKILAVIIRDLTQRRQLEFRLLEIGNEERRKIGRELHDGLGQMLTGTRMLAESLARKLRANALPASGEVQEIADMIKEADEYARALSKGLVRVDIEKRGFTAALESLCTKTSRLAGIECTFLNNKETNIENETMVLNIYRIVQESVNNAIKHGKAKNITVRLASNDHHLSVSIDDDGIGFDPENKKSSGIGLQIMSYRAGLMGGIFEINKTDNGLTRARCIIPNNMSEF